MKRKKRRASSSLGRLKESERKKGQKRRVRESVSDTLTASPIRLPLSLWRYIGMRRRTVSSDRDWPRWTQGKGVEEASVELSNRKEADWRRARRVERAKVSA